MTHISASGAWLPVDRIIKACDAAQESILEGREEKAKEMTGKGRWYDMTIEDARNSHEVQLRYASQEYTLKTLRRMAKAIQDMSRPDRTEMFVSAEDFRAISSFW